MANRNDKARKAKRAPLAPEFIPNEYLAKAVMDWLDAIGKATQAQRRVEALCRPRTVAEQRGLESTR